MKECCLFCTYARLACADLEVKEWVACSKNTKSDLKNNLVEFTDNKFAEGWSYRHIHPLDKDNKDNSITASVITTVFPLVNKNAKCKYYEPYNQRW